MSVMASEKEHDAISTATASVGDQKEDGLRGKLNKVVLAYSGGLDSGHISYCPMAEGELWL